MKTRRSLMVDPLEAEKGDVENTRSALTASVKELTDRMNPKKRMHEVTSNASDGAKHALSSSGKLVRGNRLIRFAKLTRISRKIGGKKLQRAVVGLGILAAIVGVVRKRSRR